MLHVGQETRLVGEHGLTDRTRPHSQAVRQLTRFRMAREMFTQTSFVDVAFAAHWTRMVGGASFGEIVLIVGREGFD